VPCNKTVDRGGDFKEMTVISLKPDVREGLFDRVASLFEIIDQMPHEVSDEEVEGVLEMLPDDVAETVGAFLIPRNRRAGLAVLRMLARYFRGAREAKEAGKKVILIPFNFLPELIHAFEGAHPLTSEVLSAAGGAATEGKGHRYWDYAMGLGIPDHLCSASTIELGSMLTGRDLEADAIASTTAGACDANSKIHEFVANYLGIPQFVLEKPVEDNERGREQYRKNFYTLVAQLEEFIGEELNEERLRSVIQYGNRAAELHHELWDLKRNVPCPVPNLFNYFCYMARFTMWGTPDAIECYETMVDVAKKRLAAGEYPAEKEVARCGWLYVSYYIDYAGLFNWMEERGYTYLWDVLDLYFPEPINTASKETMIDGLAEAARTFPMTAQMGANSMSLAWIEDMVRVMKDLKADCGIYCGHHACKQTWSVISMVQKELMKRAGVPTLSLQGDAWLSGVTPMSALQTDIDEFIRNVVAKQSGARTRGRKSRESAKGLSASPGSNAEVTGSRSDR